MGHRALECFFKKFVAVAVTDDSGPLRLTCSVPSGGGQQSPAQPTSLEYKDAAGDSGMVASAISVMEEGICVCVCDLSKQQHMIWAPWMGWHRCQTTNPFKPHGLLGGRLMLCRVTLPHQMHETMLHKEGEHTKPVCMTVELSGFSSGINPQFMTLVPMGNLVPSFNLQSSFQ